MVPSARRVPTLFAVLACAFPAPATAQSQHDSSSAAFAHTVRAATAIYRDRNEAIASGYRLIGPDFPGMGEHWVNISLLMQRVLDPARPTILSYAVIDGQPSLIGVAFAISLERGESPPPFPGGDVTWHFHSGSVHDESFLPHGMRVGGTKDDRRLAVAHAWVWLENPEGMFARNNWALPYTRAGLDVPARPDAGAAQALALVAGNLSYYRTRFANGLPDGDDADGAQRIRDAAATVERLRSMADPRERDRRLAAVWATLCARFGEACRGS